MIKRIISILLFAVTVLFSACADSTHGTTTAQTLPPQETILDPSNYVVRGIMEYPEYPFQDSPSNLDLRLRAVSAFKDLLSIRWSIPSEISYNKTGPISEKTFHHDADVTYAGTIYSNANTGLFQFLEFYDFDTGRLLYPGDVEEMKESLGASCADAMIWGITTVCNSITGPYYPVTMVYKNGYLPIGDYTYDFSITSYNQLPTYKIVEQNGQDVILDAYTKVRYGDMFVSTPDNHGMMAISVPIVIYTEDGSVDMDNSYVMIQDQRGGRGSGFYEVKEGSQVIRYSGRTSAKFTFRQLYEKCYLPVTTAEFAGIKPYETAEVTVCGTYQNVSDLVNVTVKSNYPLAVVNVIAEDQFGNEAVIGRKLFSGGGEEGVPREFALSELACLRNFSEGLYNHPSYTIKVEVVPSSGERFVPIETTP